eukprot:UN13709
MHDISSSLIIIFISVRSVSVFGAVKIEFYLFVYRVLFLNQDSKQLLYLYLLLFSGRFSTPFFH